MAKLTDLPPEIIRDIAQRCDDSDLPTFKSASRVCKQLKDAFQERLFVRVHLHNKNKDQIERFSSIAMDSTHLLRFISSFSIVVCTLPDEELLLHVLSHAFKIRRLILAEDHYTDINPDYSSMRVEFCKTISSIVAARPLEEIYLQRLDFIPINFLTNCRKVKLFSIADIGYEHVEPLRSEEEEPIQLETLQSSSSIFCSMEWVQKWLLHPKCLFDIRNVKTLNLEAITPHNGKALWDIMKECAQTVESMHVDLIPLVDGTPVVDFSIFPNLRTLHLRISRSNARIDNTMRCAFRNVQPATSIQKILIDVIRQKDEGLMGGIRWIFDIHALSRSFIGSQQTVITFFEYSPEVIQDITYLVERHQLDCSSHFKVKFCKGYVVPPRPCGAVVDEDD